MRKLSKLFLAVLTLLISINVLALVPPVKAQGHTVTYDTNGGIGQPNDFNLYTMNDNVIITYDLPIRHGFHFTGWLYDNIIYNGGDNLIMPDGSITLVAQWQPEATFTVIYNPMGGYGEPIDYNSYSPGNLVTVLPDIPVRNLYRFVGWRYGGETYWPGDTFFIPYEDVYLDAQWEAIVFNVYYDGNGGVGSPIDSYDYNPGSTVTVMAEVPTLDGYVFTAWLYDGNLYYANQTLTMPNDDVVFIAQWSPLASYGVTYDANGGVGAPIDPNAYLPGSPVNVSTAVPEKAGYTFAGWLYNSTSYQSGNTFTMPASNVVLVAQWLLIETENYTVTVMDSYAASSGAGIYFAGALVNIDAGTRPGYTFTGWTINTDNALLERTADRATSFIMPNGNVTVTANWTADANPPQQPDNPGTGDTALSEYLLVITGLSMMIVATSRKRKAKRS